MTAIQVDWSYALAVTGVSILLVFLLLVILIVIIKIEGVIMSKLEKRPAKPAPVVAAEPKEGASDEAVMAAIAMALQLHYNSHDEVPGMIQIQPGETTHTPWCARNKGMNRLNQE